jgi:phospholipase C
MSVNQLMSINHIVVLMLENRSFDHMLGFLYRNRNNVSPAGQPFAGLAGTESNLDANGNPVAVFAIEPTTPNAYFMPGADPGEGYTATNEQLFGRATAPTAAAATNGQLFGRPSASTPALATNTGFVTNYAATLVWESKNPSYAVLPGTVPAQIMGIYTPATLPVLSALARGYAVCDHWFSSVPTETMPNRAFVNAGTSQGHMDDKTHSFTAPSIFGLMTQHHLGWSIYGYTQQPKTRLDFSDTAKAPDEHFGLFTDFQAAAAAGTLPPYSFLEPSWETTGNSQHPNYDVALGEQLIHDVYYALRKGPAWNQTLLIVTYDEHGGCYDHVAPPGGATPPDTTVGEYGFDFKRFGVRVPTVLISPLIAPGTVFRVPAGATPLDHTSILKTVEQRWTLPPLTARDAAAVDIGDVLTLGAPRIDDPLAGVVVPSSMGTNPSAALPSHLQRMYANQLSQVGIPDHEFEGCSDLKSNDDYRAYIDRRLKEVGLPSSDPRPAVMKPVRGAP